MVFHLLNDPIIRVRTCGRIEAASLPALCEALAADAVESFPALRAHQRHPWHALVCQLGALACIKAGLSVPPSDAASWRTILEALTPDYPDGDPWRLVSPPDKPGFLQPVVGPLDGLKSQLSTPDELDMLVTSKNHDLKGARMIDAEPDDWLFALVALQTSEGFLGAGNYGVSRINGGFANRPGVGLAPKGSVGAHVIRDVSRLIAMRQSVADASPLYDPDGPALLWLLPWDGATSLSRKGLDPYYIEVCRRVRLVETSGRITARAGGSKVARIQMTKEEGGVTGDPWAPLDTRDEVKVLTIDARGFDYRRLSDILFGEGYQPAPLQLPAPGETGEGWMLLLRALARGQGKTEGYHERRVMVPGMIAGRMRSAEGRSELGGRSKGRIEAASAVRGALRFALMTLFQNGPDEFKPQDPSSSRRAEPFLDQFQAAIDADFFERLFAEEAGAETRRDWLLVLLHRAQTVLDSAKVGTPSSAIRRHRALVRADSALRRGFFGSKDLKPDLKVTEHAA